MITDEKVSIIIVNWNARDLLRECLRSVYRETPNERFEVIVVDNRSSDASCEMVRNEYPHVILCENTVNLGFAAANNQGAEMAKGQYLLLLNPDTVVHNDSILNLLNCAHQYAEAGAWGGVCELPDGTVDPGCRQIQPSLRSAFRSLFGFASRLAAGMDRSREFEGIVPILHGAYMMVPSNVWRDVGGFDETFTLYSEETDLCYRIRKAGYEIYMTGKSRITHNAGSGNLYDPVRKLNCTRGVMHFYRKHFTPCQATCAAVMIWIHSLERALGSLVCMPWLGVSRSRCLRKRMSLVWRHPTWWWNGWQNQQLRG